MCLVEPLGRLGWSLYDLAVKNRNFSAHEISCHFFTGECFLVDSFWRWLIDKFLRSKNLFQNFWSYISILNFQISTDYSVFDRFCFLCVVCLFWWFYGFLWWVFAIEKLEYSRYNARTKYELVWYNTYSSDLYSYTNRSHEGFVEFCVIEVFKFWVILRWMKE